jgi:hypothetical protein
VGAGVQVHYDREYFDYARRVRIKPRAPTRDRHRPETAGGAGTFTEESSKQTSDITVSEFNEPIHLAPPAGALDLLQFER